MPLSICQVPALPFSGRPQPSRVAGTSSFTRLSMDQSSPRKASISWSGTPQDATAFHTWVGRLPTHCVTRPGVFSGSRVSFTPLGPPAKVGT